MVPKNPPPTITANIIPKALTPTFFPISFGSRYHASNCCIASNNKNTTIAFIGETKTVTKAPTISPIKGPK
ncbi:hypothetical protein CNEONATNEC26_02899 [Clostridium neonatale]|nr:hypothetical protein CNEONATNEC26_02899 [Clostridium neonatale]